MRSSKVFYTNMRCPVGTSLLDKLDKVIRAAGIEAIDFQNKFVAIKMHFGEKGNLSFLRPNFAKAVADRVKALGGIPFLTDCNTLYIGSRKNAIEHMQTAQENGFLPITTGCQVIIADGLKGTDDIEVPVEGGKILKSAYIGRAIMDADIFISLTHFKGHEMTGFGGTLKNIGMGSGSRAGKMAMHCNGKPVVDVEKCKGCRTCTKYCAQGAISMIDHKSHIDHDKCVGCGRCIGVCNFNAIQPERLADGMYDATGDDVNRRMVEYAQAVVHGRPHFHISLIMQVSPCCDCHGENDAAIVPDLGIFASFDPVALDHACIDAVNAAPVIESSALGQKSNGDHFGTLHPTTHWRVQIEHAEEIGLGTGKYELVKI